MALDTVNVKVVVYEGDEEVETLSVGYFAGQPYSVLIDTPDGVDRRCDRVATADLSPMGSAV